ncbi:MAG: hypothetical protein RLZZ546_2440 [Bacteroidota bacterium]
MSEIICREQELALFQETLKSNKAELVAVIGRRRVGKTFIIREFYKKECVFEFAGIFESDLQTHMQQFSKSLSTYFYNNVELEVPKNWFKAFDLLEKSCDAIRSKKKKVIFLDELPWMATSKSNFKSAFGNFWNNWASKRNDIILIITGSSTSWMYNEVFLDKGGLYQRVTRKLFIEPFTLKETEKFLKYKKVIFNKSAILELYLSIGGIPFYLDLVKSGESVPQLIDRLFFKKNAELRSEFDELFKSLFGDSEIHKDVVKLLAKHLYGLSRTEITTTLKVQSSGNFTKLLDELDKCGFLSAYIPFGKLSKDKIYKLTDPFTLFHLKFINENQGLNKWEKISKSQQWISWSGLAFENTCFQHIECIKEKLRIGGIYSTISSWRHKGDDTMKGVQIDMLIDRDDKIINLCEIKYYSNLVVVTSDLAKQIRMKMTSFAYFTKSKKSIFPILIAPYGMQENEHSQGLIQNVVELDDLFKL